MSFKESDLIGQLLIQKGLITVEALERALSEQAHSQERLGDILIRLGLISDDDFYKMLSQQSGVEYIKIKDIKIDPAVIENIPAKFACHYELIPIKLEDDTITVAMVDPLDILTIDNIKVMTSMSVSVVLARPNAMRAARAWMTDAYADTTFIAGADGQAHRDADCDAAQAGGAGMILVFIVVALVVLSWADRKCWKVKR